MAVLKVETHGQVFTPSAVVKQMLALRHNEGRVLEPSCGDGAFSSQIPGCVALELDAEHVPPGALQMDFFEFPVAEKFATIIGNPPYIRHQDILPETKALLDYSLFDLRSNLYLFFIEKCVHHLEDGGELIFIVPREFIKATAAAKLNQFLYENGTITHFIELGDARVFQGAVPNTVIFRYEKGLFNRALEDGRVFSLHNGQLLFTRDEMGGSLGDLFFVKVGAVSGADQVFEHSRGNQEFVCSTTIDTGATRRMFYNKAAPELEPFKSALLARGIRRFTEANWWQWGRGFHESDAPRVYVNMKTRRPRPFFTHACKAYDGSVLALFSRSSTADMEKAASLLNEVPWEELGFVCDGRFLFSQKSLEGTPLPSAIYRKLCAALGY